MKTVELPDDLREMIESLKHGSFTIECDVKDALENAESLKDFKERASGALNNLIQEASDLMKALGHKHGGPHIPLEMDEFREMAADIIDEVTEAIQTEYPDLKPKKEFIDETPDAAILYGASYYNLESRIEDQLRDKFASTGRSDV
jgi:hypothetical protein